jgi:hypothetical protein
MKIKLQVTIKIICYNCIKSHKTELFKAVVIKIKQLLSIETIWKKMLFVEKLENCYDEEDKINYVNEMRMTKSYFLIIVIIM